MSMAPLKDCKLKINERAIQARLSLHVGKGGFSLWDDGPGAEAHFSDLAPRPESLHDLMQRQAGRDCDVELLDEKLGWIDEFRGYAAADMGPHTRRVTSLRFALAPQKGKLKFRFDGNAGPVDPGSIFQGSLNDFRRSNYRFEVEFEIAYDDLQSCISDPIASEAFRGYIASLS